MYVPQQTSDMLARSILGAVLPEAMIHYLENYGEEKFAEIFLGDFDTPEAIWNNEMRCVHCLLFNTTGRSHNLFFSHSCKAMLCFVIVTML